MTQIRDPDYDPDCPEVVCSLTDSLVCNVELRPLCQYSLNAVIQSSIKAGETALDSGLINKILFIISRKII